MFELSVAWKYLLPRRRQLSVSIISLISIFVIALVVWLVVLFFSITNGMERHWISKLVAVTAPVRMVPTAAYYHSYYYQIDGLSLSSHYTHKSIREKLNALTTDPYDPLSDEEIPDSWPQPDQSPDRRLKDLVKEAFTSVTSLQSQFPGLRATPYETAFGNIRLSVGRGRLEHQGSLAQAALFGSLDPEQKQLQQAILPLRGEDVDHVLRNLPTRSLKNLLSQLKVNSLRVPSTGWRLPPSLLPSDGKLQAIALSDGDRTIQLVVPSTASEIALLQQDLVQDNTLKVQQVELRIHEGQLTVSFQGKNQLLPPGIPVVLAPGSILKAEIDRESISNALRIETVRFQVSLLLQGYDAQATIPLSQLEINDFELSLRVTGSPMDTPPWLHWADGRLELPKDPKKGEGVLLPKPFQDAGILVGDGGHISYQSPSISTMQEQQIPIFVAGFYDPGIIPTGGRLVLVPPTITSQIRAAYDREDNALTNGINVSFTDVRQADQVKKEIEQQLRARAIDRYWKVETFRNYEFTKELLQQLRSDRNLSMVIASVIILVACSNIVSMLIILVNDKKREIGILRSMGASSRSIMLIFGGCGVVMGLLGSLTGMGAAVITLHHLDSVLALLERIQGYEIFNPTFYGSTLPNEISLEGLAFVLITTMFISALAGLIPALKASLLKPSEILRTE